MFSSRCLRPVMFLTQFHGWSDTLWTSFHFFPSKLLRFFPNHFLDWAYSTCVQLEYRQHYFSTSSDSCYVYNLRISFQIVGCMILGYMAWVLATSITVSRFLSGTLVSRAFGVSNGSFNAMKFFFLSLQGHFTHDLDTGISFRTLTLLTPDGFSLYYLRNS